MPCVARYRLVPRDLQPRRTVGASSRSRRRPAPRGPRTRAEESRGGVARRAEPAGVRRAAPGRHRARRSPASTSTPRPRASTAAGPAAPSCSAPTRSSTRTAAGRRSGPRVATAVELIEDRSLGMVRTEVRCATVRLPPRAPVRRRYATPTTPATASTPCRFVSRKASRATVLPQRPDADLPRIRSRRCRATCVSCSPQVGQTWEKP